jgi:hypothetical protein
MDFLYTADFMVPDPDAWTEMVVAKLGIVAREDYRQGFADHGYIAHFLRVNPSRSVAPTLFEPQHHVDVPNPVDPLFEPYLDSLDEFQGRFRPIKTHSCVIATDDIDGLIDTMHQRRIPFRVAPIDAHLAWERVWVGCSPEQPRYRPDWDGGLCLEWHPIAPLAYPDSTFQTPIPVQKNPQPADMVRILSRTFLVRDIDAVLRALSDNLDIEARGPVETFAAEGFKRARIGFELPHSATIDLVEPTSGNSETGRYLATWGPGPYAVCIAVNDLDAKADDLRARGTNFELRPDLQSVDGPAIRVDPRDIQGTVIDFVPFRG